MSALAFTEAQAQEKPAHVYLELKTWHLHTSHEDQAKRVRAYLEQGLFPALTRAGARPVGAYANLIGENGPYLVSLVEYRSLAAMEEVLAKLEKDEAYTTAVQELSAGPGLPFVRVESALLKSLSGFAEPVVPGDTFGRVFELRTYESQTMVTLGKKVGMFNSGEIGVFERLGMKPVFFSESVIGPKQPCVVYMLSFDSLAAREKLWGEFGADPEWKKISAPAELKDAEIVGNISNVLLKGLGLARA